MDNSNDTFTKDFTFCLDSNNMLTLLHIQKDVLYLDFGTGTTLDCAISDIPISDHKLVFISVNLTLLKTKPFAPLH